MYRFLNGLAAHFPYERCRLCGLTPYSFYEGLWRNSRCPANWFGDCEERDFEYLRVKVPVKWERILAAYYGNWRKFVRGTCNHDGELYTDPDKSYREVLPEKFAKFGYTPEDFA